MTRCRPEPAIFVQAGDDKVQETSSGQCIRLAKEVSGSQAPVDTIETKVLCEPVVKFIPALMACQRQSGLWLRAQLCVIMYARNPESECIARVFGRRAEARWAAARLHRRGRGLRRAT